MPEPLILASASPRRQQMLRAAELRFRVEVSGIDEAAYAAGTPRAVALKTALAKAADVGQRLAGGSAPAPVVVAADTIVVVDGEIYGKPADRVQARAMLERLSGRTHEVLTGVAVQQGNGAALVAVAAARVTFHGLAPEFITEYLATGEADDKAGAYGIQGLGARLVAGVAGDLTGVIGLPLGLLDDLHGQLTGSRLFTVAPPRAIARAAFPELALLPPECLAGIPG